MRWEITGQLGNQRSCRKVSFATQMEIASLQINTQNKVQVIKGVIGQTKNQFQNTRLKYHSVGGYEVNVLVNELCSYTVYVLRSELFGIPVLTL